MNICDGDIVSNSVSIFANPAYVHVFGLVLVDLESHLLFFFLKPNESFPQFYYSISYQAVFIKLVR